MLKWIWDRFFKNTLYVRIRSDLLSVTLVEQNRTIEDKPLVALAPGPKGKRNIVAVGSEAQIASSTAGGSVTIHNGFDHPRSCVQDFEIAKATLQYFIRPVGNRKNLVRPIIVVHPLEKVEGGLTQIEYRALRELAESVGVRKVYVWTGRVLDFQELISLQFPQSGGKLYGGNWGWSSFGGTGRIRRSQ
ncbi:MAG TPA: rod shape-determining protein [Syntrophobacteraceae bacterium]|nr:rod shape-determining protein [Syntrophobacteraceae bacterium]